MKLFLLLFGVLWILNCPAQLPDTVLTKDSRQKRDISSSKDSLSDRMEIKMVIPKSTTVKKTVEIRVLKDSTVTENSDQSSEMHVIGGTYKKSHSHYKTGSRFDGSWQGFYYGFVNFAGADYSMYPLESGEFMDLDWGGSFSMQFNLIQKSFGLNPTNSIGLVTGIGLEYQRLLFQNKHISIIKEDNSGKIIPYSPLPPGTDIKRNGFKILYMTLPLLAEFQIPVYERKKIHLSGGIVGGIRLHSKTKIVFYDDDGDKHKKKNTDNFNIVPFKADILANIGFSYFNVWGSYTLTELFRSGKGPELHPYAIGIGIIFD